MTASDLQELANVGPAVAARLARIGITRRAQLAGRDPEELFELVSADAGQPEDPCLLDTFRSAVDQADGKPARPWWEYSRTRRASAQ